MERLDGKSVLLTGGLGTLGAAQAQTLSSLGATVVILDRPDSADAERFASAIGAGVTFLGCDLNNLEGIQSIVQPVLNKIGGFDILINNAALIINKPFEEFSLEQYEDQIRVNSSAAFALVKICAPAMKAKEWGRIINFTSVTLKGHFEGYVPYIASKGAMLGLTKSLARELGPFGICVNSVAPGAIVSDAENRVFGDRAEEYSQWVLDHQCLKFRIEAPAVADLVAFLTSPASDAITGQDLAIDGGW